MADLEKLIEQIEELSLPEVAELKTKLEDRWGVSAAAPMMVGMPAGGAVAAEADEEQTEFDLVLDDIGPEKIKVIKAVREINKALGLKDAKEVVESAPAAVLHGVTRDEAETAQKVLQEAGAKAVLK